MRNIVLVVTTTTFAVVAFACSSPANTDSTAQSATKAKSATSSSNDGGPNTSGGACSAQPDSDSCYQCCDAQVGLTKFDGAAIWDSCACETPGACKAACGDSYCKAPYSQTNPTPGDACDTCLQAQDNACSQKVDEACRADATCAKATACAQAAGCDAKPAPASTADAGH